MSALLASPGLSVLRSLTPQAPADPWLGFTYLPPADTFTPPTPFTLPPSVPLPRAHTHATPARATSLAPGPRESDSAARHRSRRAVGGDLDALRELADYGALKSAQKRRDRSSTAPARSPPMPAPAYRSAPPPAPVSKEPSGQLRRLEARHQALVGDLDTLTSRLASLEARSRARVPIEID
jgi:hypothetical protein